jgi:lysophospholipase L1-like esterase
MNARLRRLLTATLISVSAFHCAQAAEWITSWAASPMASVPPPIFGPMPFALNNQTIRQVMHLSAGGARLRIRLSNEYGGKPLTVGAATVALVRADGTVDKSSIRKLTFAGQTSVVIPAAAPLLSDPVELPVKALSDVSLSLYFPEDTGLCTCHQAALQDGFVSAAGDFTAGDFPPAQTVVSRAFVAGVDVEVPHGKTIVVLGDSISDGIGSAQNANHRWPDVLARRLNAGTGAWGVANEGISGNRILQDGAGQSALARFDRDVLAIPGVAYVIVFEGVNDLGLSYGNITLPPETPGGPPRVLSGSGQKATSQALIAGYRQIIARAHARGIKVFGATIAPYEGAMYWSAEGESQRQAINEWIRRGGEFDAVLDFDAVFRDPDKPTHMAQAKQSGDFLHGSDAGYQAVGDSIDLRLFR